MSLPLAWVTRSEDELIGCLISSQLARDIVTLAGLKSQHFSDYYLSSHGTRARLFDVILSSDLGIVAVADKLNSIGGLKPGDGSFLVLVAELSIIVPPDYERLVNIILKAYIERQTAKGDIDSIKHLNIPVVKKVKGGVQL